MWYLVTVSTRRRQGAGRSRRYRGVSRVSASAVRLLVVDTPSHTDTVPKSECRARGSRVPCPVLQLRVPRRAPCNAGVRIA